VKATSIGKPAQALDVAAEVTRLIQEGAAAASDAA
jgi:hypothetical protein